MATTKTKHCCSISVLLSFLLLIFLLAGQISAASQKPEDDSSRKFEGFDESEEELDEDEEEFVHLIRSPPLVQQRVDTFTAEEKENPADAEEKPEEEVKVEEAVKPSKPSKPLEFYWDEDEFEGVPVFEESSVDPLQPQGEEEAKSKPKSRVLEPRGPQGYYVEVISIAFLIAFAINFFFGKKQNERIALAWASQFATKDGIFERNFSLLGAGSGDSNDDALLLKEGQNVFKFYASGRRFCQGLLATLEVKSRHDLISRIYNCVVPCKDEVTIEVFMNEDAMDHVVFALARRKAAKAMQKDCKDLNQCATVLSNPPNARRWLADDLAVISESKEVAVDLVTEMALEQVFGEKAFEKHGQGFISLHFTDLCSSGSHKKVLIFKFALPSANKMADMTRLIALVPYYIDLVGRYRLSSQTRVKAETTRAKIAQELYKEQQLARQEVIQRKKEERRKASEEAETKMNAEAVRKKEEKDRQRQLKKSMPRIKMTRVH